MNPQSPSDLPVDPKLNDLLNLLKEVPPRDPETEARGRIRFLSEVDSLFEGDRQHLPVRLETHAPGTNSHKRVTLTNLRQRLVFTYTMAILAMLIILFGGASVTAYASQTALPGDALYPVKTGLELTQVRLSRDAARQAQLHMSFAERRLDEIALLVAQGRFEDIDQATLEFETSIHRAINTLKTVAAGDPIRAQELATQISDALARYAEILKGMLTIVPDPVRPTLEKAILTSETEVTGEIEIEGLVDAVTADGWIISGQLVKSSPLTEIKGVIQAGMMVKVHALISEDGTLIAREIEAIQTEGELITNENENENVTNDNEDDEGEDEVEDEQDQDNESDNDNHNMNSNQNDNAGNDNEDDDGEDNSSNGNENDNENDNEDGENDNQNDNDDENDNGDHENDND